MRETLTPAERAALDAAKAVIDKARAKELHRLLNWKNGSCLSIRERPQIPELTAKEDAAVRAVWKAIPSGSSSWMTAFHLILNAKK